MRVIFSGGGTGGHIYPALATIRELKRQDPATEILYIGTAAGLEATLVPREGIPFQTVKIQGLRRSLSPANLKTLWLLLTSIRKAKQMIQAFEPDVVVGTGGYVCAPVLYAASRLHIPTIIHEQNSIAGLTNKFLARYVSKIAICFDAVRKDFQQYSEKIVLTGNPRAQEVATGATGDLSVYGLKNDIPTVLVFGGSRGAERLNAAIIDNLPLLEQRPYQTLIATGERYFQTIQSEHPEIATYQHVKLTPYINNMPEILRAVALVVARSGATTLMELTALGKPSILIPSPNVTHNHQQRNAEALVKQSAAKMLLESDLTAATLLEAVDALMNNRAARDAMAEQARALGVTDAGDRMIKLMRSLVTKAR